MSSPAMMLWLTLGLENPTLFVRASPPVQIACCLRLHVSRGRKWTSSSATSETKDCSSTRRLQNVLQKWQGNSPCRTSRAAMWSGKTTGQVQLLTITQRCLYSQLATTGSDMHMITPSSLTSTSFGPLLERQRRSYCRSTWMFTWARTWLAWLLLRWRILLS